MTLEPRPRAGAGHTAQCRECQQPASRNAGYPGATLDGTPAWVVPELTAPCTPTKVNVDTAIAVLDGNVASRVLYRRVINGARLVRAPAADPIAAQGRTRGNHRCESGAWQRCGARLSVHGELRRARVPRA
jgi:hypothetical protein